ncbi:MAG: ParB N-terminal domain-containing protein [Nanoarchaeota archaeon]
MEIENIPISEIIPYEKNPRKNEKAVEIVAKSIKEFGFKVPIILDKNNEIIAGHTRLKAAIKLKMTSVPIIRADELNEEQVKAFRIMDNKSIEYAEWDYDLLEEELKVLQKIDFDLSLTGFSNKELYELMKLNADAEFDVDKEVEEAIKRGAQRVKENEVWQLGEHKLIIGNSVNRKVWEKLMENEKFDLMFTDPPYRLSYTERMRRIVTPSGEVKHHKDHVYPAVGQTDKEGKSKGRFKGIVQTKKGFGYKSQRRYLGVERSGGVPEFDEWLSIAKDFQNQEGSNILIFENWKNTPALWTAIEKYWKIRNLLIWHTPNRCQGFSRKYLFFNKFDIALLGDDKGELNTEFEGDFDDYLNQENQKLINAYDTAIYAGQGKSIWNRVKRSRYKSYMMDHITCNVDSASQSGQSLVFGTKPIPILVPYMKTLSPVEGIIMEPYGGSGSTLIAAEILHRKCRCIEIEPIYAEVIIKRWERFTNKTAKKLKLA